MDGSLTPLLLAGSLVGLGGGMWLLARGLQARGTATRLADTATSTIGSLAVGEVRVSGTVEPAELTLRSPLQDQTCVYYRARVRSGDRGERTTVFDEERAVGFKVRDATGAIRLFPRDSAWDVPPRLDDVDDDTGAPPPGLSLRYGPAVEPGSPDRETLVARLLEVRPGLGSPGLSPLTGIGGRGVRDYLEARIAPGDVVTVVGSALPFAQLPDPEGADLGDGDASAAIPASGALQDPEIAADLAAARETGILESDPEEAWGNAAIPGFGIGQPVREPELDPAANPLAIADEPTAERFERIFEIADEELVLAAAPDHPLLVSAGPPTAAIARHEDRFMIGLLGAVLAILSAVALALQIGGMS